MKLHNLTLDVYETRYGTPQAQEHAADFSVSVPPESTENLSCADAPINEEVTVGFHIVLCMLDSYHYF